MNGVYRFYQHGKLIATQKNLITTEGRRLILRYLSGTSPSLGGAIGLGVSAKAATVSDVRLGFEVFRVPVTVRNSDYASGRVLFKGTIEQDAAFTMYESCLWSTFDNTRANADSEILTNFDPEIEEWTNATTDATQSRTSVDSIKVSATANATTSTRTEVDMDLSGYSTEDIFRLAFHKADNNIASITLVFENVLAGGNFKLTKTVSSLPTGYNVLTFRKGDFVATGAISWDGIDSMGLDVTAGGTAGSVILDGLRVEDTDTINQDHIMVSRTVLTTPLVKTDVAPMDVEYSLEFNVA
jgi:hypothetical protein